MLIKLGDAWVDPTKVEIIAPEDNGEVSIAGENFFHESVGDADDFASIVNGSLNQQSFGGDGETQG